MAESPSGQQQLQHADLVGLPDDIKTNIISKIPKFPKTCLYPAVCVNQACRNILWSDPAQLRITVPVGVSHDHIQVIKRGTIHAITKRAELSRSLQGHAEGSHNSHSVTLVFREDQGAHANHGDRQVAVQTEHMLFVLRGITASTSTVITRLIIQADFLGASLHLPSLPNLTYLHLTLALENNEEASLTRQFFEALHVPQLQELCVQEPLDIPVHDTVPPSATRLRKLSVNREALEYSVSVPLANMPALPELVELHTSASISISALLSMTSRPLPSLEQLTVYDLVPSPDNTISIPHNYSSALRELTVLDGDHSLTLAAHVVSGNGNQICLKTPSSVMRLFIGESPMDLDPTDPRVGLQVSEFNNVILPMITSGRIRWDTGSWTHICFPRHLATTLLQVLGPLSLLPAVQLKPRDEQELRSLLQQVRLSSPSSVLRISSALPEETVAELMTQCWPDIPRDQWISGTSPPYF